MYVEDLVEVLQTNLIEQMGGAIAIVLHCELGLIELLHLFEIIF
jgi:hypothetical protein